MRNKIGTLNWGLMILALLCLAACAPAETAVRGTAQTPADSAAPAPSLVPTDTEVPTESQHVAATDTPTAATATPAAASAVTLNTSYSNAVSIELQLLVGTFKLQGTKLAVTKSQASTLLPLWTGLKTITQNLMPTPGAPGGGNATPQPPIANTEIQKKIDSQVKQIQAAMTSAQLQAIAGMKITQTTVKTLMQQQGITAGGPQSGNGTGTGNGKQAQGTPPAGGQLPQQGTPPAGELRQGTPPAGNQQLAQGVPPGLIDALIQLLQKANK